MGDFEVVEDAGDDCIDDFGDGLGLGIEGGVSGDECGAGLEEEFEVADVDEAERGFAGDEDEAFSFLEHNVGGAEEDVIADAVGDSAEGTHAAGDNDHGIGGVGATGEVGLHTAEGVGMDTWWDLEALGEFFAEDGLGVAAEDDMDLVCLGVQVIQEALGVETAASAGDGYDQSHGNESVPKIGRAQYGVGWRGRQVLSRGVIVLLSLGR